MKLHKKAMLTSGFCAILVLLFACLFAVGEGISHSITADLDALGAGERWSASGEPYAVIALHTDTENAFSLQQVESSAMAIDAADRINTAITTIYRVNLIIANYVGM
jgi:hypothetical protein